MYSSYHYLFTEEQYKKIKEELGRNPSYEELAIDMNVPISFVRQLIALMQKEVSLDSLTEKELLNIDFPSTMVIQVEEDREQRELEETVEKVLKKITNSSLAKELATYTTNPEETLENLKKYRDFYNRQGYRCCKRILDFKKVKYKEVKK